MDLGAGPGIVQLMPGDSGADEHMEACGPLHHRVNRSQPQIQVHKNYIFLNIL